MVVPLSLRANVPISGNSLKDSIANGLTGFIFTIAPSPVFQELGLFFNHARLSLDQSLQEILRVLLQLVLYARAILGVYPGAITVG